MRRDEINDRRLHAALLVRDAGERERHLRVRQRAHEHAVVEVAEILEDRSHPATSLLNRKAIEDMLAQPLGNVSSLPQRAGLERARSIGSWVKDYEVVLDV